MRANSSSPGADPWDPSTRRRLTLRKGKGRSVELRHPWVFSGAIAREEGPEEAALGDLYDPGGRSIGSGFYSAHSQIRLRLLTFGEEELTRDVFRARIARAVTRRAPLVDGETDAVRLIHSEGDDLSGLVVDRYADALVVEIGSAGAERVREEIIASLRSVIDARTLRFRNDLPARRIERLATVDEVEGESRDEVIVREGGLRFVVPLRGGQKTGFFLDQRPNRALVRRLASGRHVLNLFSYSGAFGVYAAAGGARGVEEVEISPSALDLARRNHDINASKAPLTFVAADAFAHSRTLIAEKRSFDLVICDPPAFARSRGEVDRAARGYKDINLQAMRLLAPGGLMLTFSCSGHVGLDLFQKIVFSAALDAGRRVSILRRLGAGTDHPVSLFCPETEYLKGFLLQA